MLTKVNVKKTEKLFFNVHTYAHALHTKGKPSAQMTLETVRYE